MSRVRKKANEKVEEGPAEQAAVSEGLQGPKGAFGSCLISHYCQPISQDSAVEHLLVLGGWGWHPLRKLDTKATGTQGWKVMHGIFSQGVGKWPGLGWATFV